MSAKIGEQLFAVHAKVAEDRLRAEASLRMREAEASAEYLDTVITSLKDAMVAAAEVDASMLSTYRKLSSSSNDELVKTVRTISKTLGEEFIHNKYGLRIDPYMHVGDGQMACWISWGNTSASVND